MPTSRPRSSDVVICSEARSDSAISVVRVEWKSKRIIFSNGDETFTPYERMLDLATWLCQEQAAVTVRLWPTRDGTTELVELRRLIPLSASTATIGSDEVF